MFLILFYLTLLYCNTLLSYDQLIIPKPFYDLFNCVKEGAGMLMVSGSAPLPAPLHAKWFELSGHKLLERYGMTEIGMCLSNLYDSDRSPGFVGVPLPSVNVALADQNDGTVILQCSNQNGSLVYEKNGSGDVTGELLVKGDSVFKEYFGKPEATRKEFINGWFKTGDLAQFVEKDQKFRILGRKSVDIIKSGGYKISALQIETLLLEHEKIKECAVLGVPDDVYGERVGVIVVPETGGGSEFDLEGLSGEFYQKTQEIKKFLNKLNYLN